MGIQAVNVNTKITLRTTSNEAGNYQIPFVVPGNYSIEVSHPGFKNLERDGIRVLTGTQVTVDLQLELGAASDSVTVVDAAPLLNPASGDLGQVLDNRVLSAVTIGLGKNVLYAVRLAPGVNSGGGSVTGNGAGNYQISGGGSTDGRVEYLIDGIPNTVAQNSGGVVYIPSIDAVEEIKVQTTMFDAAYGHTNSGAINITTKGGTNTPHGTVYMYKQWGALNANSWANNKNGIRKPTVHYYQYGYLFGGPVYIPRIYNGTPAAESSSNCSGRLPLTRTLRYTPLPWTVNGMVARGFGTSAPASGSAAIRRVGRGKGTTIGHRADVECS